MMSRDRPIARLTRHFFTGLFDLGFLSEAGTLSFTRLVIGACAVFLSFGLLLARGYLMKYAYLAEQHTPDLYLQAILADHALLIAIPMWIVAFTTVLIGHAVFPDELDFRVLTPLPISRRLVFGAKVLALTLFVGLFFVSGQIALGPMVLLTSVSRWAEGAFVARVAAYGAATFLASGFAALAVVGIQGLLVLLAARGRVMAFSAALRSVMLCALMVSLPLVARLPAQASGFAQGARWLYFTPVAWFLGVERWLSGDPRSHFAMLTVIAVVALVFTAAIAVGSYWLLYRHFERLIVRRVEQPEPGPRRARWRAPSGFRGRPLFRAIRVFAFMTLRRSVLHQGIVVVLSGIGAGLVVNSFVGAGLVAWVTTSRPPRPALIASVIWTPVALMYVVSRAVRMALLVPIEARANWIFRMTERDEWRADQLEAAASTVRWLGVAVPIALIAPIQWLVIGQAAFAALAATFCYGWLYVELLMMDWGRLPFTCSYLPGKRFVPQAVLMGLFLFVGFTSVGAGLARLSLSSGLAAVALDSVVLAAVAGLRQHRRTWSRQTPLEFEDSLPNELNPLRLGPH